MDRSTHPQAILRTPETIEATRYRFSEEDEALLDEVQRGCFNYFWHEVGSPAGLAKDRKLGPVSSVAAVGFQLSALVIGVERGWVEEDAAEERAISALRALLAHDDNKKFGMYLHFPDVDDGGPSSHGYHAEASTVDTALLLAGAMTASEYFGGEVRELVDRMLAEANWRAFAVSKDGYISMAWKPASGDRLVDPGEFIESNWWNAGEEERLVYFLAVGSPTPQHAVAPSEYYRLQRPVKQWNELPPHVVTWPGTLFTYFFAQCWIDYRAMRADAPSAADAAETPPVDWFENSRRAVLTHRRRCIEESARFSTLSADRWGLSACSAKEGYIVPEIRPNIRDHDDFRGGTIAPYAAGSAIMFTPAESIAALRAFRELKVPDECAPIWDDPASGGYGFADSFNLEQPFVSPDYLGIDQGPMLLAIENVRSGLIWKLFMDHPAAERAAELLEFREW